MRSSILCNKCHVYLNELDTDPVQYQCPRCGDFIKFKYHGTALHDGVVLLNEPFRPNVDLMKQIRDLPKTKYVQASLTEVEYDRLRGYLLQRYDYYTSEMFFCGILTPAEENPERFKSLNKARHEIAGIFNKLFAPEKIEEICE